MARADPGQARAVASSSRRPESTLSTSSVAETDNSNWLENGDPFHDQLGDAVASCHNESLGCVIDKNHADNAAVVAVDHAGGNVDFPDCHARSRRHPAVMARRDGHLQPSRYDKTCLRQDLFIFSRVKIKPCRRRRGSARQLRVVAHQLEMNVSIHWFITAIHTPCQPPQP